MGQNKGFIILDGDKSGSADCDGRFNLEPAEVPEEFTAYLNRKRQSRPQVAQRAVDYGDLGRQKRPDIKRTPGKVPISARLTLR